MVRSKQQDNKFRIRTLMLRGGKEEGTHPSMRKTVGSSSDAMRAPIFG